MVVSHILDKPYTEAQLSQFKEAFTKLKTYKDGTIHKSEHLAYLNSIGLPTTPAQVEVYQAMFRAQRGDDLIPLSDIIDYLRNLHDPAKLTMEIAKHFDKNGDGVISEEEFQLGMNVLVNFDPTTYGDKAKISYSRCLAESDSNKDGKIQVEELAAWLSQIPTSHILSEPYTLEELDAFRDAFKKMKTYKDGHFHASEYKEFCNSIGIPTTSEQALVYQNFWKFLRGDELVPLEETIKIISCLHDPILISMQLSQMFDKDNDGIITQEEFEAGMKCLMVYDPARFGEKGNISFEQFMAEADANKDGKIQVEELALWLGGQTPSHVYDRAFTPQELDNFRNIFRNMKTYKDGSIHLSEQRLFQNLAGVPTSQAQVECYNRFFQELTGEDRVPMEEVMRIFARLHDPKELILELINIFDKNNDGVISESEFEIGMKCLVAFDPVVFGEKGKVGFEEMLREADTNKDGKVQISEMAAWLTKNKNFG